MGLCLLSPRGGKSDGDRGAWGPGLHVQLREGSQLEQVETQQSAGRDPCLLGEGAALVDHGQGVKNGVPANQRKPITHQPHTTQPPNTTKLGEGQCHTAAGWWAQGAKPLQGPTHTSPQTQSVCFSQCRVCQGARHAHLITEQPPILLKELTDEPAQEGRWRLRDCPSCCAESPRSPEGRWKPWAAEPPGERTLQTNGTQQNAVMLP